MAWEALREDQVLVNVIRECLGMAPLYVMGQGQNPENDGEEFLMTCPCTGLPQRAKRGESTDPRTIANRGKKRRRYAQTG